MAFLQIRSTPIGPSLLIPETLLLNRPVRRLLSKFSRLPIVFTHDRNNHNAIIKRQPYVIISASTH